MPVMSASPLWQRRPWGPSDMVKTGMPYRSMALLRQKSAPVHRLMG